MTPLLQGPFEGCNGACLFPRIFGYPSVTDLLDRHRIEKVPLLPPASHRHYQPGRLQDAEMLGDRLAGHLQPAAQLAETQAVGIEKPIEDPSSGAVRQCFEDSFHGSE